MRAPAQDDHPRAPARMRALILAGLALTLFAAVLDRRDAVLDPAEAVPDRVARPVAPPTPAELVREMLTHD